MIMYLLGHLDIKLYTIILYTKLYNILYKNLKTQQYLNMIRVENVHAPYNEKLYFILLFQRLKIEN